MDAKDYRRVKRILLEALEYTGEQRAAYVMQACAGDEGLRAEVEALLAEGERPAPIVDDGPLETSVGRALADALEAFTGASPKARSVVLDWLKPGAAVEQFELIREIGRGGVGVVYLARDVRLGRHVALKFLQVNSPEQTRRFLVEAQVTAQCHHENIVVIHQVGEAHGIPYLAFEYLNGDPLSKLLGKQALSPPRALEIVVPVVRALVCAHEAGIAHRDLKPANIFVTQTGHVKVLDFGIAKDFTPSSDDPASPSTSLTQRGNSMGTPAYMSPEQWGAGDVDHRTDIWAIGIILWRMLAGRHPLELTSSEQLKAAVTSLDVSMPNLAEVVPSVPEPLSSLVSECLAKDKDLRIATAGVLLDRLERIRPRPQARPDADSCPYPGMAAFSESDADLFFGRQRDVESLVRRLEYQPLLGVAGPSGVGKSSLILAGLIPALKRSDKSWETFVTRPARDPVGSLTNLLQTVLGDDLDASNVDIAGLHQRLRVEPGYLGQVLRARSRAQRSNILLYVDQFEELYTQSDDRDAQQIYRACLTAVADDPSTPLRVILSVRSDLVDRIAEDRDFIDHLSPGLTFLPPLDRDGLHDALVAPLAASGYEYEPPVVDKMLDAVEGVQGGLPLLQFTAARLWEKRDQNRRRLTADWYEKLGGVVGTLAQHADTLVSSLSPAQRGLLRQVLLRLVTPERTRALVQIDELGPLSSEPAEVNRLIDTLVRARLITVHTADAGSSAAVELIHESLIDGWPSLRRWVDSADDDTKLLEQLSAAARQWNGRGQPEGLLWSGEAAAEARRFRVRYTGQLTETEAAFLDAVQLVSTRAMRRSRRWLAIGFATMTAIAVGALVATVSIRQAEQAAQKQRRRAEQQAARSQLAEDRVRRQYETIKKQKEDLQTIHQARILADKEARDAAARVDASEKKRRLTYQQLEKALERERRAVRAERAAKEEAERLNVERQTRIRKLVSELSRLATRLDD